jgi:TatD DNase family protein
MPSDAHAHPADLLRLNPQAEAERRSLGVACAASAWDREEFLLQEKLAKKALEDGAAPLRLCYAVHPQLPRAWAEKTGPAGGSRRGTPQEAGEAPDAGAGQAAEPVPSAKAVGAPDAAAGRGTGRFDELLGFLETLAGGGRISAVGETGFDLYDFSFRDTEAEQDALFAAHLELARRFALPLVLHIRRAAHKVFAHSASLKKVPALVFHSYSGTLREAEDLLKRGINAYFSFGTGILLNHKEARRSCALLPAERLLLETDAPYQPLRGRAFSSWADLDAILHEAASLRLGAEKGPSSPAALEALTDENFRRVFG